MAAAQKSLQERIEEIFLKTKKETDDLKENAEAWYHRFREEMFSENGPKMKKEDFYDLPEVAHINRTMEETIERCIILKGHTYAYLGIGCTAPHPKRVHTTLIFTTPNPDGTLTSHKVVKNGLGETVSQESEAGAGAAHANVAAIAANAVAPLRIVPGDNVDANPNEDNEANKNRPQKQ